jgi:hypothetical protein
MDLEDCAICGLPLNKNYSHKLNCNHEFHYECLVKTFGSTNRNKCPYCREKSDYRPPINGIKKFISGIHYGDIKTKNELENNHINTTCQYIFVKGKNKGNKCGKNCKLGYNVCNAHLKV